MRKARSTERQSSRPSERGYVFDPTGSGPGSGPEGRLGHPAAARLPASPSCSDGGGGGGGRPKDGAPPSTLGPSSEPPKAWHPARGGGLDPAARDPATGDPARRGAGCPSKGSPPSAKEMERRRAMAGSRAGEGAARPGLLPAARPLGTPPLQPDGRRRIRPASAGSAGRTQSTQSRGLLNPAAAGRGVENAAGGHSAGPGFFPAAAAAFEERKLTPRPFEDGVERGAAACAGYSPNIPVVWTQTQPRPASAGPRAQRGGSTERGRRVNGSGRAGSRSGLGGDLGGRARERPRSAGAASRRRQGGSAGGPLAISPQRPAGSVSLLGLSAVPSKELSKESQFSVSLDTLPRHLQRPGRS